MSEKNNLEQLENGMRTAFIDHTQASGQYYRPRLISNDYQKGRKVITAIESELQNLEKDDKFYISVAFITEGGLELLLHILSELREKGVKGQILTTDYLTFSSPKALKRLNEFDNIEVRLYRVGEGPGFHTKGYIFRKDNLFSIIVGSSNLTSTALTKNAEWNTKLVSTIDGEFVREMLIEFNYYWSQAEDISECIDAYERIFKEQKRISAQTKVIDYQTASLKPNEMQVEFTVNLNKYLDEGKRRVLLISATGTGKTYASAFALRDSKTISFDKVLFVVHREQIARQALDSYRRVFGQDKTYGILSGSSKQMDADLVFSTVQTISKDEILNSFRRDEFDAIVIDEVHRAGASMHQKVIDYFEPKLYLGMTASPERTDGYDIYDLFDHNIAYEIRLQQAMEGDYLCPFHYFGIADFEIDGKRIEDNADFNLLVLDARVDHIIDKIEYYGYSGDRVKGLVFCCRRDEAAALSKKFNERGYRTLDLSGVDSQEDRQNAIDRLVGDNDENALDYIFTVDIFNEGVDIPEINQVVMLRPTQSPIVFVQQLGRGLRKYPGKEFVVVIDFIGNYNNNFMIPIALSGDRSYNPDKIRKYVREGSRVLPGESSIHFDRISRQRIYDMISKMRPKKAMLQEKYFNLKHRLGRIPSIVDFYEYGEIDPMLFIQYSKSYDQFVRSVDVEYKRKFTDEEEKTIEYVSAKVLNGKRIHELKMLQMLMQYNLITSKTFISEMNDIGEECDEISYASAVRVLKKEFVVATDVNKYENVDIIDGDENMFITASKSFKKLLDNSYFKHELGEMIHYGIMKYNKEYALHDENGFVLYEKYSRRDVCRILNWEKDESSTVYGYRIKYNTCPIFITYEKKDDIEESTKYPDEFIDENMLQWSTRNRVTIDHKEAQAIIHHKDLDMKIYIFIKKDDDEGSDFYYMGTAEPDSWVESTIMDKHGKELPVVHFAFKMDHEVRSDIYEYITENSLLEQAI